MQRILITLIICLITTTAYGGDSPGEFLAEFVRGHYQPDSLETYYGQLVIYAENEQLKIRRIVGQQALEGEASIETALGGETQLLRMRFIDNGIAYEESCLVQGDLDNYARISCYLYRKDGRSTSPGLEALFFSPDA